MSHPYGLSIDRLTELFGDLYKYIKTCFQDFNEKKFLKTFCIGGEFIFNFRRFYELDEVILSAYLRYGIQMEYNDIICDSNGNELSFDQCQDLVKWYLGDESVNLTVSTDKSADKSADKSTDKSVWIPMNVLDSKLDLNNSIYSLFRKHIREVICPDLNVKAKFEKREVITINKQNVKETSYVYFVFIGLQIGRGLPLEFSEMNLKTQIRHKYQDYIIQCNQEMKQIQKYKDFQYKIKKSAAICRNFLIETSKKYKNHSKDMKNSKLMKSCGELIDEFITNFGIKCSGDEAFKLSEQIYESIKV